MSYILHLGHQVTDLAGVTGLVSTDAAGFDPAYDVNCIRVSTRDTTAVPFSASWAQPAGDVWLGFRYRAPSVNAQSIGTDGTFLEFYDDANRQVAHIRTERDDNRYRALAIGDTSVDGRLVLHRGHEPGLWVDVKISVGADITIAFYIDGALQSQRDGGEYERQGPPPSAASGRTTASSISTTRLSATTPISPCSTASRPSAGALPRRTPDLVGTYDAFSGGIDAIRDGDIATRAASDIAGQRLSFSLAGPTGPAGATSIAGVHVKKLAQLGTAGPTGIAGFLRMNGVDYDATPGTPSADLPSPVYSSWELNPTDSSPWTAAMLPAEAGIVSS